LAVVSSGGGSQPLVDGQAFRQGLGALRAGHEEIGHFVSSLFEELDAAWIEFEDDHTRMSAERQKLADAQADFAARRGQWESDHRVRTDALQRRVVELEKDRLVLKAELESARAQATDLHQTLAELQQRIATERTEWNLELRLCREVLDRQSGIVLGAPPPRSELTIKVPANMTVVPTFDRLQHSAGGPPPVELPQYIPAHLTPGPLPRAIPTNTTDMLQRPQPAGILDGGAADPILGPLLSRLVKLRNEDARPSGDAKNPTA
jgi:hypothetical protein